MREEVEQAEGNDLRERDCPFEGYRYQVCVLVDFDNDNPLQPRLKYVIGRLGTKQELKDKRKTKCLWNRWPEAEFTGSVEGIDKDIWGAVVNLVPLFLLAPIYASKGDIRRQRTRQGRPAHLFRFCETEFSNSGFGDVFNTVWHAIDNLQNQESEFLKRSEKRTKDLQYTKLNFLCPGEQRRTLSRQDGNRARGFLCHSFEHSSGREGETKTFSLKLTAPFGADDVFICDFNRLVRSYRRWDIRLLSDISIRTKLKKYDISQHQDAFDVDRLYACILAFARCSYAGARDTRDGQEPLRLSREEVERFRVLIENNLEDSFSPLPKFDKILRAERLQRDLVQLVKDESEGTLQIENVYPLRVQKKPISRDEPPEPFVKAKELLSIEKGQVVVVSGDAGQGKSTTLRHLAWLSCNNFLQEPEEAYAYPIYLPALKCRQGLVQAISGYITPRVRKRFRKKECERLLAAGAWIVFLDGFDDLLKTSKIRHEISELVERNDKFRIIIATRTNYEPSVGGVVLYQARDIESSNSMVTYLKKHGINEQTAHDKVDELSTNGATEILGNPLLLWGVALLLRDDPNSDIPSVPGSLLEKLVEDHFLAKWEENKERRKEWKDVVHDDVTSGLGELAYWMVDTNQSPDISKDLVKDVLKNYFTGDGRQFPGTLALQLRAFAIYSSLLIKVGSKKVKYRHDLFRNYLAAHHLTSFSQEHILSWLKKVLEDMKWDEVVTQLAELLQPSRACDVLFYFLQADAYQAARIYSQLDWTDPLIEEYVRKLWKVAMRYYKIDNTLVYAGFFLLIMMKGSAALRTVRNGLIKYCYWYSPQPFLRTLVDLFEDGTDISDMSPTQVLSYLYRLSAFRPPGVWEVLLDRGENVPFERVEPILRTLSRHRKPIIRKLAKVVLMQYASDRNKGMIEESLSSGDADLKSLAFGLTGQLTHANGTIKLLSLLRDPGVALGDKFDLVSELEYPLASDLENALSGLVQDSDIHSYLRTKIAKQLQIAASNVETFRVLVRAGFARVAIPRRVLHGAGYSKGELIDIFSSADYAPYTRREAGCLLDQEHLSFEEMSRIKLILDGEDSCVLFHAFRVLFRQGDVVLRNELIQFIRTTLKKQESLVLGRNSPLLAFCELEPRSALEVIEDQIREGDFTSLFREAMCKLIDLGVECPQWVLSELLGRLKRLSSDAKEIINFVVVVANDEVVDALREIANSDRDPYLAKRAFDALAEIGDRSCLELFEREVAKEQKLPQHRELSALRGIGSVGGQDAYKVLLSVCFQVRSRDGFYHAWWHAMQHVLSRCQAGLTHDFICDMLSQYMHMVSIDEGVGFINTLRYLEQRFHTRFLLPWNAHPKLSRRLAGLYLLSTVKR